MFHERHHVGHQYYKGVTETPKLAKSKNRSIFTFTDVNWRIWTHDWRWSAIS